MSRRTKLLIGFFALVAAGWFAARLISSGATEVPPEFTNARLEGALVAQTIVTLSNESIADLAKINELDQNGKFQDAMDLTVEVIKRSQDIRDEAIKLSGEVEKMTTALSGIDSFEARQAALESISNRLALISRLVNYSGYLGQLLDALRIRFGGGAPESKVGVLIEQINSEVNAINNFNAEATQAMERFDKIVQ